MKALRDLSLIGMLYVLGLRRAELCSLDISDFDRRERRLRVIGKGHTDGEWLSVPDPIAAELEKYLQSRGSLEHGPLFASVDRARKGDGRLSPSGLYKLLQHLAAKAGVLAPVSPHKLRHSCITAALDGCQGDVRRVRHFSRHAKFEVVMAYDDARKDEAGQIANMLAADLGVPAGGS